MHVSVLPLAAGSKRKGRPITRPFDPAARRPMLCRMRSAEHPAPRDRVITRCLSLALLLQFAAGAARCYRRSRYSRDASSFIPGRGRAPSGPSRKRSPSAKRPTLHGARRRTKHKPDYQLKSRCLRLRDPGPGDECNMRLIAARSVFPQPDTVVRRVGGSAQTDG